jgi:WD40 repeat protein
VSDPDRAAILGGNRRTCWNWRGETNMRILNRALTASLFAALTAAGVAAQAKRPITLEDLWAVKRLGAPSLDPAGRWAAVEVTTFSMEDNAGTSDIWLLSTDGKEQRRLTAHSARDSAPQWSPDGRWIAFTSRREGDEAAQIYVISPAASPGYPPAPAPSSGSLMATASPSSPRSGRSSSPMPSRRGARANVLPPK